MEDKLREILNSLYEAEGLVELALRREPDARAGIVALAVQKCFDAADCAARLNDDLDTPVRAPEPVADNCEEPAHEEQELAPVESAEQPAPAAETIVMEVEETADPAEELFIKEVLPAAEAAADKPSADIHSPLPIEDTSIFDVDADIEVDAEIEAEEEQEAAIEEAAEQKPVPSLDEEAALAEDTSAEEEGEEEAAEEEAASEEAVAEVSERVVTPELGIVRKPLSKYMTINDKFRFRRELFSNSAYDFNDALSLIETMESMEEVSDYFFNDLQWDPENPEVKEFTALVERYMREGSR